VDVDLRDFELIDACGMPNVVSTSIAEELGRTAEPPTTAVVGRAGEWFARGLAEALGAALDGDLPPAADPAAERSSLEAELARAEASLAADAAAALASREPGPAAGVGEEPGLTPAGGAR
jgi:hypothetical protein